MFATLLLCCSAPVPTAPPPLTEPEAAALVAKLASDDREASAAALQELTGAGPAARAAVPALVKLLAPDHLKRYEAMEALRAIGPGAKGAVPALLALLPKDGGSGYAAERVAVAVAAIDGPKPELTRALLMTSAKCTPIYLEQSALLHSHPADAVRHLCALCADKGALVRQRAATVLARGRHAGDGKVPQPTLLARAGSAAALVPPALEHLLADSHPEVRLAAARAAVRVAPELTDKAVAAVIDLAKESVGAIKPPLYAHDIFAPTPERAAARLLPLFDSASEPLREWAVRHAAELPVRAELEALLADGATARARAGAALALGLQSGAAAPALKGALKDRAFEVRFAAGEALTRTGDAGARAAGLPALVEGLTVADAGTRERACERLTDLRAEAKPAVPDLQKLLNDPAREVQFAAALALAGIDPPSAAGAVPVLAAALAGTERDARRAAVALGALGPAARGAVPALVKQFDARAAEVRVQSASAVGRIDPARAPDAVKVLAAVLDDPKLAKGMPRLSAVLALRAIGPPAKGAVPALERLLTDDRPFHAEIALTALALDPDRAPARAWARAALADKPGTNEDTYDLFDALPGAPAACAALVPDLIPLLGAKGTFHRRGACEALGAAGPAAQGALPKLKELAEQDTAAAVRRAATDAVRKIEAK